MLQGRVLISPKELPLPIPSFPFAFLFVPRREPPGNKLRDGRPYAEVFRQYITAHLLETGGKHIEDESRCVRVYRYQYPGIR